MSLLYTSKNTLRYQQKFDRLFFASFAMEPFQSFGAEILRSEIAPKELYKFSLVTM